MLCRRIGQPSQGQRRRSRSTTYLTTVSSSQQAQHQTWAGLSGRRGQQGMTSVSDEREPRSWLTDEVRMDPFLLQDAHRICRERGGGQDGYLAARRLLDERLCQMVHWPAGREYALLADDLAAEGRRDDAALLRQIAATDHLLTEAQTRWNIRYASRPQTVGERDTRRLIDAGLIDFDPDGPYRGLDGSQYWPGYTALDTGQQVPVVLVAGRGHWQLVTGFDDQAGVARWLHDRGPMASGPLTPPDVPTLPRAVLEEHILARMLCRPGDLPTSMAALPPTIFTADARYDIYAAILTVASTGQPWDVQHVAAELAHRMHWVPEWALPRHGGQGTPWPQAYLRRLASTEPLTYGLPRLIADDMEAHLWSEGPETAARHPDESVRQPQGIPGNDRRHQNTSCTETDAVPKTWRSPGSSNPMPRI
jgi:hypothetical protein